MEQERQYRWLGWIYAVTTLLSAFLLFQVQPLISKFILPWFGGSPTVWTTAMLFFQTALFAGYVYAHINEHWLRPGTRAIVHLVLIVAALAMLPAIPAETWKPAGTDDPTWRILALLGMTVGLPYFVLSSTGPLIQAWFSRTFPGRSPYRLYALSNIGSLAALLTYPVLVEPTWDVRTQAKLWAAGFVAFAVLCGYGAVRVWTLGAVNESTKYAETSAADDAPPSILRLLLWLLLPGFASAMLLATTNYVCQDVAVIPFLWVAPLALYLLSFIICFDAERWYLRSLFAGVLLITMFVSGGVYDGLREIPDNAEQLRADFPRLPESVFTLGKYAQQHWPKLSFVHESVIDFTLLFCLCMLCHGELVRLRPAPKHLTTFYIMISAGGALGGILVSLVAPHVFDRFSEWPIGVVIALVLGLVVLSKSLWDFKPLRLLLVPLGVVGVMYLALVGYWQLLQRDYSETTTHIARNFYGVVRVAERDLNQPEWADRALYNGRIIHGIQFLDPDKRRLATTYYGPESGVGQALGYFRSRDKFRVGTIGLGGGTIAAYGLKGHRYTFYDINPEVVRVAENVFTYLSDSDADVDIVLGDARLSLERQDNQQFNLLAIDAFSGDAIPTHLLTREAFEIYGEHMAPESVIAVHITNRHLDLDPVVAKLADYFGYLVTRINNHDDNSQGTYEADWMLLTKDRQIADTLSQGEGVQPDPVTPRQVPLWTDAQTNLFQILQ